MFGNWFDRQIDKITTQWAAREAAKQPTLEERINARIEALKESFGNEVSNAAGYGAHLDTRLTKLERRNERVDAHYVRVMATAFDEKHGAFAKAMDDRQQAFQASMNQLLKDHEEFSSNCIRQLQEEIAELKRERSGTAERLERALAKLRSIGEGN